MDGKEGTIGYVANEDDLASCTGVGGGIWWHV